MKNLLPLLPLLAVLLSGPITTVTIDTHVAGSTPTVLNVPDESFWGMDMRTETIVCAGQLNVDCGTQTAKVVALSTGPYVLKAASGDCYRLPFINPNGTTPKSPLDWTPCPL